MPSSLLTEEQKKCSKPFGIHRELKNNKLSQAIFLGDAKKIKKSLNVSPEELLHARRISAELERSELFDLLVFVHCVKTDNNFNVNTFLFLKSILSDDEWQALPLTLQTAVFPEDLKQQGTIASFDTRASEIKASNQPLELLKPLLTQQSYSVVRAFLDAATTASYYPMLAQAYFKETYSLVVDFMLNYRGEMLQAVDYLLENEDYSNLYCLLAGNKERNPSYTLIDQYLYQKFVTQKALNQHHFSMLCALNAASSVDQANKLNTRLYPNTLGKEHYFVLLSSVVKLVGEAQTANFFEILNVQNNVSAFCITEDNQLIPAKGFPLELEQLILGYAYADTKELLEKFPQYVRGSIDKRYEADVSTQLLLVNACIESIEARLSFFKYCLRVIIGTIEQKGGSRGYSHLELMCIAFACSSLIIFLPALLTTFFPGLIIGLMTAGFIVAALLCRCIFNNTLDVDRGLLATGLPNTTLEQLRGIDSMDELLIPETTNTRGTTIGEVLDELHRKQVSLNGFFSTKRDNVEIVIEEEEKKERANDDDLRMPLLQGQGARS